MKKLYRIIARAMLAFVLLVMLPLSAWAQIRTITGKLTSADDGSPLPGANVIEKGTTNGTVSDTNGNFNLTVKGDPVLVISFIGYVTQEVTLASQSDLK